MRKIFKYPLRMVDKQLITMPSRAKILSAKSQGGQLCLWAEVRTELKEGHKIIAVYGTGNPMPDEPGKFIDTVVMDPFVWHVYELER